MDKATRQELTRLLKRGLNHYGLGDLEAAIACWERALTLDPENRAARDYLDTAYDEAGLRRKGEDGSSITSAARGSDAEPAFDDDETPRTDDEQRLLQPQGGRLPELPVDEQQPDTMLAAALEAYKEGRLQEAWQVLQEVSQRDPDRLDVQGYLVMVRSERARQWARDIGDQGRVVQLARTMQELMKFNLTPEEGFLLSQIDGQMSIEELLNLSQDRVKTLEILARFIREGIVE